MTAVALARPRLVFDAAAHAYTLDGTVRLPSVTQILQGIGATPDYREVSPAVLEQAAERARYIETCCRLHDEAALDLPAVHPVCRPYVDAWIDWKKASGFMPCAWQEPVVHPTLGYAGTRDIRGTIQTTPIVVELKCTAKLARTYRLQVAAYTLPGLRVGEHLEADAPGLERRVVQLRPTGGATVLEPATLEAEEAVDDWQTWQAAVALYRWGTR